MENKTFKRLKARKRQVEKLSRDILGSHETVTPSPPDDHALHSRSHEIDDEAMEEHDSPPPPPPDTIGSQETIIPVLNDHVPFVDMGKSRQKEKRAHRRKTLREEKIIEGQIVVKTTDGGQPRGDHRERFVQRFRNPVASRVDLTVSNVKSYPRVEIDAVKQGLEASYDCKYVEKYFKDKFSHVFRNLRHEKMRERNSANRAKFMRSLHMGRAGYVGLKDDMEKELGTRTISQRAFYPCAHFQGK